VEVAEVEDPDLTFEAEAEVAAGAGLAVVRETMEAETLDDPIWVLGTLLTLSST